MMHNTQRFKAMIVRQNDNHTFLRSIESKHISDLPEGDVLIHVKYSSLNYKDALSATGNQGVTRHYPHTPGIDAAGIVVNSQNERFQPGDEVIVTGYDLGMNTAGGFGQYIMVPAEWVIPLPKHLTLKESMIYGTAGFTAALSVYKLVQAGISPHDGEILVTGSSGGVGSIAVRLLCQLGYDVIAVTGKSSAKEMLKDFGVKDIMSRKDLDDLSGKALLKSRWAGVIDTVGGNMLVTAIKSTKYGGAITCCGNVKSPDLSLTVYPFILRGVTLFGIDSVLCPLPLREQIWQLLANDWKLKNINLNVHEVSLESLESHILNILQGKLTGRTIVTL